MFLKRPIPVLLMVVLCSAWFAAGIVGVVLNPTSYFSAEPSWYWLLNVSSFVLCPATARSLWRGKPIGRWLGLTVVLLFAAVIFGAFWYRSRFAPPGSYVESPQGVAMALLMLLGFAYWLGFSKKSRQFFGLGSPEPSS